MTTIQNEIKNTTVMTDNLMSEIEKLIKKQKDKLTEKEFEDVKGDDCEMRSRGICMYDETATEILLLVIRSADINYEELTEAMSEDNLEYLQSAIARIECLKNQ